MSKTVVDLDDPKLARALAHPTRVGALRVLESGDATPRQIAERLGLPLEQVVFHVRKLREADLIELREIRPVRSTVERIYRLKARPRLTAQSWEELPEIYKEAAMASAVKQLGGLLNDALIAQGFTRPDSQFSRRPLVLDSEGFAQASKVLTDALNELTLIETRAHKRIKRGADAVPSTAVALLFQTPNDHAGPTPDSLAARPQSRKRRRGDDRASADPAK